MTPTVINDRPRRAKCFTVFPTDEIADFQANTAEEIGVVMQMRWHAWHNGGIENTEENLQRLRRKLGISGQKFRKLWPYLQKFFVENNGFLHYSPDERRRQESEERAAKLHEAGKKGAEIRWESRHSVPKTDDSHPILKTMPSYPNLPNPIQTLQESMPFEESINTGGAAAAAAFSAPEQAAAAGPAPGIENLARVVSDQDFQDLARRSIELGMQAPDRSTTVKILQKFPSISPRNFPRFKGQKSPGLWLHKEQQDLETEMTRQEHYPDRKPTAVEMAREIDKRRANQL
jgi:uncharacterized protein YdaU (DUF1376 family)